MDRYQLIRVAPGSTRLTVWVVGGHENGKGSVKTSDHSTYRSFHLGIVAPTADVL